MRKEKKNLESRFVKMERDIEIYEEFNREFTPRKQRKLKRTRWDFSALNKENDFLNTFARKAFDPSNIFVDCPRSAFDSEDIEIVPMITQPHRITAQSLRQKEYVHRFVDKYDDSAYVPKAITNNRSESSGRLHRRSQIRSTSASMRSSQIVNIDDTVDKFVDDIEKLRE